MIIAHHHGTHMILFFLTDVEHIIRTAQSNSVLPCTKQTVQVKLATRSPLWVNYTQTKILCRVIIIQNRIGHHVTQFPPWLHSCNQLKHELHLLSSQARHPIPGKSTCKVGGGLQIADNCLLHRTQLKTALSPQSIQTPTTKITRNTLITSTAVHTRPQPTQMHVVNVATLFK